MVTHVNRHCGVEYLPNSSYFTQRVKRSPFLSRTIRYSNSKVPGNRNVCQADMISALVIAALAAQTVSGHLIARHEGHDEAWPSLVNTRNMTGLVYPTSNNTAYKSIAPSQSPTLCNTALPIHMTATTFPPPPSSIGSHAPYSNTTSTEWTRYRSGTLRRSPSSTHASPSSTSAPLTTAPWAALWTLHWPVLRITNSSVAATPTPVPASNSSTLSSTMTTTPTIPTLAARPAHPSEQSSTAVAIVPVTTMPASSSHGAASEPLRSIHDALIDPIISNPGHLSSPDAHTSTVHITLTVSVPKPTPTTVSDVEELTSTSKTTSTLTKTVRASSTMAQSLSALESRWNQEPSSISRSEAFAVHTSVVSADPRCPYPFPDVYCGAPKMTFVTETRSGEASMTSAPTTTGGDGKPRASGWCPYPGLRC